MFVKSMIACGIALCSAPALAQCPDWMPGLARAGTSDVVYTLHSFDDGSGPALYAGGNFRTAGDAHARFGARWSQLEWSSLGGNGPNGPITSFAVFDSGSGPELCAAGFFSAGVARWDGSAWLPLAASLSGGTYAIAVFDDGAGPELYVTGYFTSIDGVPANRIAKWNGTTWSALGSGLGGAISPAGWCLTVFDDGSGPALYVGGQFDTAGGLTANGIAKWKAGAWSTLGSGMGSSSSSARVLTLRGASIGGTGPRLYAAGEFTTAGGVAVDRLASWNGSSWSSLNQPWNGLVSAMEVFDDGSGEKLYAAGGYTGGSFGTSYVLERFDGTSWSSVSSFVGFGGALSLAVHDDGGGAALYVGGEMRTIEGTSVWNVAKWTGTSWLPLGRGAGLDAPVSTLLVYDDGSGNALYAGGNFSSGGGVELQHIGRWRDGEWSALGAGLNGSVVCLRRFDDGSGNALYAGGFFNSILPSGPIASGIARWDGASWSALGSGVGGTARAMVVFNDGTGPKLFVGGSFLTAGSTVVNHLASWDGTTWSDVGGGVTGGSFIAGVNALVVFDDGSGQALYAAGSFTQAGTTNASHIARWNGTAWQALGSGLNDRVLALTVFDDGTGFGLYAGGVFTTAGGASANRVARWNGSTWSAVGSGIQGFNAEVRTLRPFVDGTGADPVLVAGGKFSLAGGGANLARLVGTTWRPLAGAFGEAGSTSNDPAVSALAVLDDELGNPQLFVGGDFQSVGKHAAHFLARLSCVGATVSFCFGSSIAGATCPCFNADVFGNLTGCLNSQLVGAELGGSGSIHLGDDQLVLSSRGMTGPTSLYFQGTATVASGQGAFSGDGLMCAGGSLVRLRTVTNVAGSSSFPGIGDPSVSAAGFVGAPGSRTYQVLYRDVTGMCSPNAVNFTNAVQVGWGP